MLGSCGSRIQLLESLGAWRASGRRSESRKFDGQQAFHDDDVAVTAKR